MDEELRRYLDGEVEASGLPPRLRDEARRWRALVGDLRAAASPAPPSLEEAVMREVRAGAAPGEAAEEGRSSSPLARGLAWLFRPLAVPLPPALPIAAAAGLVLWVLAGPGSTGTAAGGPGPTAASSEAAPAADGAVAGAPGARTAPASGAPNGTARIYVEFSLEAPDAREVAVAGDFTDWAPSVRLHDRDGDGVWSGRIPVPPGIHEYMFVVDGERWMTDPRAERYSRDGFGHRNAVLTVALPSGGPRSGT